MAHHHSCKCRYRQRHRDGQREATLLLNTLLLLLVVKAWFAWFSCNAPGVSIPRSVAALGTESSIVTSIHGAEEVSSLIPTVGLLSIAIKRSLLREERKLLLRWTMDLLHADIQGRMAVPVNPV